MCQGRPGCENDKVCILLKRLLSDTTSIPQKFTSIRTKWGLLRGIDVVSVDESLAFRCGRSSLSQFDYDWDWSFVLCTLYASTSSLITVKRHELNSLGFVT